jgi:hypothetical protein
MTRKSHGLRYWKTTSFQQRVGTFIRCEVSISKRGSFRIQMTGLLSVSSTRNALQVASRSLGQNLEILISVGILVPTLTILILLRMSSKKLRPHLDNGSLSIICLLVIPAFVTLFYQARKASLLPPRPGVHDEPFGCCSQVLVFPKYQVPRIIEHLLQGQRGQI